jgi:hypothetical protein
VKKKISIIKSLCICLLLVAGSLALTMSAFTKNVSAAGSPDSCTAPSTTYGTDTMSVYVPATATYTLWTRMEAASPTANSILLNVDSGANCYNLGGDSSIPTDGSTWTWVDDYDSNTANIVNVSLSQGTHTFELTGTESGVAIDRIIAVPTTAQGAISCTPTDTQDDTAGNNCAPLDNTASAPPTVSVTAPTAGATVSGTTTVSANATDSQGIASVQFELDGSPLGSPVVVPSSGSTYSYSWNTSGASNAGHSISAIATDTSGYTATSGSVSVTVNNSSGGSSAPSTPTLQATASGTLATAASISWPVSSDTGGTLTGYHLYRGSTLIASPTGTSYTDSCLTPGTTYSYTITAYDASHTSATSSALSVTTEGQLGDLDADNTVTGHDLSLLLSHYGTNWVQGEFDCTTPGSSVTVEGHDLSILLSNYGK